jgi:phosphopantetheinyl transferase
MPLFLHQQVAGNGELGLWQIEENEEWFLGQIRLEEEERSQFAKMKGKRRVEWLAARMLIHHMSGRDKRAPFVKDEYGKPHLDNSDYHISISHSGQLAAAIAAPSVVGIDIQRWAPNLERLVHKFMSREEIEQLSSDFRLEQIHIFWGAKESLYKAYGRRALDFSRHMKIAPFEYIPEGGHAMGVITKENYQATYELYYKMIEQYMLVYVVEQ